MSCDKFLESKVVKLPKGEQTNTFEELGHGNVWYKDKSLKMIKNSSVCVADVEVVHT